MEMSRAWLAAIALLCLCSSVSAQVPELGRWQDFAFSAVDVETRIADRYWDMLVDLSAQGRLDDDPQILARTRAVAAPLVRAAIAMKPSAQSWDWEIHTTSDPEIDGICMAGGKLLIGSTFVRRLSLNDGELATLIGHEVAHAIADHHREYLSGVLRVSPLPATSLEITMTRLDTELPLQLKLARLSSMQESEADQIGMTLAHRAGWPAASMVSFYTKLAKNETGSALSLTHPSAASRIGMAKILARLFGK
jgi:predicted Zn-dependent protease